MKPKKVKTGEFAGMYQIGNNEYMVKDWGLGKFSGTPIFVGDPSEVKPKYLLCKSLEIYQANVFSKNLYWTRIATYFDLRNNWVYKKLSEEGKLP